MYNSDDEVKCVSTDQSVVVANALQMTCPDDDLIGQENALPVHHGDEIVVRKKYTHHDNSTDEADKESGRVDAAGNGEKLIESLHSVKIACLVGGNTVEKPTECVEKSSGVMFDHSSVRKDEILVECDSSNITLKSAGDQKVMSSEDDIYRESDEMDVEEDSDVQDDDDSEESCLNVEDGEVHDDDEDEDYVQSLNGEESKNVNSNQKSALKMENTEEDSAKEEENSVPSSDGTYQNTLSSVSRHPNKRVLTEQNDSVNEPSASTQFRYIRVPSGRHVGKLGRLSTKTAVDKYTVTIVRRSEDAAIVYTTLSKGAILDQLVDGYDLHLTEEEKIAMDRDGIEKSMRCEVIKTGSANKLADSGQLHGRCVRLQNGIHAGKLGVVRSINGSNICNILLMAEPDDPKVYISARDRRLIIVEEVQSDKGEMNMLSEVEFRQVAAHRIEQVAKVSRSQQLKAARGHGHVFGQRCSAPPLSSIQAYGDEEDDADSEEEESEERPSKIPRKDCLVGKYVRLWSGTFYGKLGRVGAATVGNIFSIKVLDYPGEKTGRHTSLTASKLVEVTDEDCSETELISIQEDKAYLQQKAEKSEEISLRKKAAKATPVKSGTRNGEFDDGNGDGTNVSKIIEITKDTLDAYVRVQTGQYTGMLARVTSIVDKYRCSVKILDQPDSSSTRGTTITSGNLMLADLTALSGQDALIYEHDLQVRAGGGSGAGARDKAPKRVFEVDISGQYVRLMTGIYGGMIARVTHCPVGCSPCNVKVVDMPGERMGRHTNATPKNVDLCPTLTPLEEQAVESDRALVTCKTKSRALADTSFPAHPLIDKFMKLKLGAAAPLLVRVIFQELSVENPSTPLPLPICATPIPAVIDCKALVGKAVGQQGQIDVKKEGSENVGGQDKGRGNGEEGAVAMNVKERHSEGQGVIDQSAIHPLTTTITTSAQNPSDVTPHPKSAALFRVSVIMDPTHVYDASTRESAAPSKAIHGVREDRLTLIGLCTDIERLVIDNDLKRRRKRAGNFENLGPNLWNLTYKEVGHRNVDGEDLVGEYVRLKAGGFTGRLARVSGCAGNGSTCSVSLLQMDENEKRKHTTISSNNLELVDASQLSKKETDRIAIDTARRATMKDRASVRSSHGLSAALKKRTALVSDKGDKDTSRSKSTTARVKQSGREDNAGKGVGKEVGRRGRGRGRPYKKFDQESDSDSSGDGDNAESRNNLYWCSSLETPVLWMGTSSNEPNVHIDVLAITRTLPTEIKDKDEETDKNKDKKDSKDISQSSASSSSSSFSDSQAIKQKGHSAASVSPTPPVPLNGLPPIQCPNRRTVARNSLRPMDDDILLLYKDAVGRELVGALLDFAEWDDHARQSYMWPAFIINILGDPLVLRTWLARALVHPIGKVFPLKRKKFLFSLIAEHGGFVDEYGKYNGTGSGWSESIFEDEESHNLFRRQRRRTSSISDSDESESDRDSVELHMRGADLKKCIASEEIWDLVLLVDRLTDNQSVEFSRYYSRVGSTYQAPKVRLNSNSNPGASLSFSKTAYDSSWPDSLNGKRHIEWLEWRRRMTGVDEVSQPVQTHTTSPSSSTTTSSSSEHPSAVHYSPPYSSEADLLDYLDFAYSISLDMTGAHSVLAVPFDWDRDTDVPPSYAGDTMSCSDLVPNCDALVTAYEAHIPLLTLCCVLRDVAMPVATSPCRSSLVAGTVPSHMPASKLDSAITVACAADPIGRYDDGSIAWFIPREWREPPGTTGECHPDLYLEWGWNVLSERGVEVFNGKTKKVVPLRCCRQVAVSEEWALELLHSNSYDTDKAHQALADHLTAARIRFEKKNKSPEGQIGFWRKREMTLFEKAKKTHRQDVIEIHRSLNSALSLEHRGIGSPPVKSLHAVIALTSYRCILDEDLADETDDESEVKVLKKSKNVKATRTAKPPPAPSRTSIQDVPPRGNVLKATKEHSTSRPLDKQPDRPSYSVNQPTAAPSSSSAKNHKVKMSITKDKKEKRNQIGNKSALTPHQPGVSSAIPPTGSDQKVKGKIVQSDKAKEGTNLSHIDLPNTKPGGIKNEKQSQRSDVSSSTHAQAVVNASAHAAQRVGGTGGSIGAALQSSLPSSSVPIAPSSFSSSSSSLSKYNALMVKPSSSSSSTSQPPIHPSDATRQPPPIPSSLTRDKAISLTDKKKPVREKASKPSRPRNSERSHYNMYWLKNSRLPCIYYDTAGGEDRERFNVLPISCDTYHYTVQTRIKELLPLTEELLQECSEERTRDFTLALIDFTQWDEMVNSEKLLVSSPAPSSVPSMESQGPGTDKPITMGTVADKGDLPGHVYYIWPDFILDLLIQPTAWAAWRKRVERGEVTGGRNSAETISKTKIDPKSEVDIAPPNLKRKHKPVTRRKAYFDALCSDRITEIEINEQIKLEKT